MNSVDKTSNCILPSGKLTRRYFECVNTLFVSLLWRHRKSTDNVTIIYRDNATFTSI